MGNPCMFIPPSSMSTTNKYSPKTSVRIPPRFGTGMSIMDILDKSALPAAMGASSHIPAPVNTNTAPVAEHLRPMSQVAYTTPVSTAPTAEQSRYPIHSMATVRTSGPEVAPDGFIFKSGARLIEPASATEPKVNNQQQAKEASKTPVIDLTDSSDNTQAVTIPTRSKPPAKRQKKNDTTAAPLPQSAVSLNSEVASTSPAVTNAPHNKRKRPAVTNKDDSLAKPRTPEASLTRPEIAQDRSHVPPSTKVANTIVKRSKGGNEQIVGYGGFQLPQSAA